MTKKLRSNIFAKNKGVRCKVSKTSVSKLRVLARTNYTNGSLCVVYHKQYANHTVCPMFYVSENYVWSHYFTAKLIGLPSFYDIALIVPIAKLEKDYL